MMEKCGKEKHQPKLFTVPEELVNAIHEYTYDKFDAAVRDADKLRRDEHVAEVKAEAKEHFLELYPEMDMEIDYVLYKTLKGIVRHMITHERQTQILNVTTLGALGDEQVIDGIGDDTSKRYIHHYNFPGYSVGEARPMRSPGRREIGHGALAERALVPVIPSVEEFPYTLRLVSEVLESNGSSSMGSVCGSTLSLMHAGVPIKKPVSGCAMGLVKDGDAYTILTDIQGMEDALGDMDFKVAGTPDGITAIQMDIKVDGLSREILAAALAQAKRGREFILSKMLECINEPNKELSPYAPRVNSMKIPTDKIRDVIGPGGKTIKKIIDETGVQIDIHDDGNVFITAVGAESAQKAQDMINALTAEVEVGAVYKGKVTRIMNFGAFVEILPGKEGLCHISQLAKERVGKVEDVVNIGDELEVKVTEIDRQGRVNLSHKVLL